VAESDQEKTEDASERQIERFRKEGKVVQSKELIAAFSMCGAVLALLYAGPLFAEGLSNIWYAARTHALDADMGVAAIEAIAMVTAFSLGPPMLLVLTAAAACSLISGVVITGFNVSTDALEPKWERLDVLAAAKQTWFSTQPLIAMVKGMLVASCVIWAAWGSVVEHFDALPVLAASPLPSQIGFVASLLGDFTRRVLPVVIAIGAGDYGYQWWKLNEDMKMDKQAVKDEHKESEGDPHIRGKRKQRQRQLALGNMLAKVQLADVVITNPTHYAIALRYRKEENAAPIVVARGVDHLALKIRAEAARQEIPVIENRPLARALYAKARAGHAIPQAFYGPVAQVLAVVLKRRRKLLKAS
jgi:flagellar biosynthesis protein FlhB